MSKGLKIMNMAADMMSKHQNEPKKKKAPKKVDEEVSEDPADECAENAPAEASELPKPKAKKK